jgi:hypothetical protein
MFWKSRHEDRGVILTLWESRHSSFSAFREIDSWCAFCAHLVVGADSNRKIVDTRSQVDRRRARYEWTYRRVRVRLIRESDVEPPIQGTRLHQNRFG